MDASGPRDGGHTIFPGEALSAAAGSPRLTLCRARVAPASSGRPTDRRTTILQREQPLYGIAGGGQKRRGGGRERPLQMNPRNLAKQGEGGMGDDAEAEDIYNVKLNKREIL